MNALVPIRQQQGSIVKLNSLLRNNRIFDTFYSHVSLIQPKGKFSLASRDVLEDFWSLYQEAVMEREVIGIAEVPQSFIPVIVDIDLQFSLEHKTYETGFYYSQDLVLGIIEAYQKVLKEVVTIKDESLLYCAWLSKKPYFKESKGVTIAKNGFHLQFYNLFVNRVELESRIIPYVLKEIAENLDPQLLYGVLNSTDYIDTKAIGNTWLLYGSSKSEDQSPYLLEKIFDFTLKEIDPAEAFSRTKIFDANDERIRFSAENFQLFLPRIFSIIPAGRKVHDIEKIECLRDYINFTRKPQTEFKQRSSEEIRDETKIARELVKILSPERAVGHNDWMRIGWTLFNITNGSEQGLDIWINFAIQKEDHDEARCIYEWKRMKNRGSITLGTLKYYARCDNEQAYLNYISRLETSKKKLNLTEKGLADMLADHIQGEFVYCKKKWFEFVGHYWQICDEGINLIKKIDSVLVPMLKKIKVNALSENEDDDGEKECVGKINSIIAKLNQSAFIKCIIEWCKVRFHDQEFENSLDKNRYLIGFNNGVYDLKENLFRKGEPSDLITNHMPIDYKVYSRTDDEVIETLNFFEKVFPNPNIRRYMLDIMSEIFVGYNHRKHVYFFTGSGDNGKSVTQMFFEKMLGRLSIKVPTTVITSKKPALGGTSEELARTGGGTRALWLEEPNQDEEINEGIFKHLSGNDTFYARGLYQTGREIEPMFKMFIICNSLPKLKHGGDKATWNRIRVIRFESTFSSNAPKDPEEQLRVKIFPKDPTLDQRLPYLTSALAWYLLEHYKLPKIDDPSEVLEATADYRSENDIYAQFISECFIEDSEGKARDILAIEYFKTFLACSLNNPKLSVPSVLEFNKIIARYLGEPEDNVWVGYRLKLPRAREFLNNQKPGEQVQDDIPDGCSKDFIN